jgi:hypothetical protein
MWAIAVVLIAIWLAATAVVWIFEALIAWRRKTPLPRLHVPRATSDPKFGRTAGAAAAILAVFALIGSAGEESKPPAPVRADSSISALRFDAPPAGTPLEGVGGEGDSGGPALVRECERLLVAGVSSWQQHDGPLGTYGCVEHYARVSTQLPWFREVCGPTGA